MPTKAPPSPPAPTGASDSAHSFHSMIIIVAMIAILVGMAATFAWVGDSGSSSPLTAGAPQWIAPSEVRATTSDGTLVKARVALDAVNASNRTAVEHRLHQVGLVLELSISSRSHNELTAPKGIPRLARDMKQRLNTYLVAEGAEPLRSVVIQDLWYTSSR